MISFYNYIHLGRHHIEHSLI